MGALEVLQDLLEKVEDENMNGQYMTRMNGYATRVSRIVGNLFKEDEGKFRDYDAWATRILSYIKGRTSSDDWLWKKSELKLMIETVIDEITIFGERQSSTPNPSQLTSISAPSEPKSVSLKRSNRVFIVHGHDEEMKLQVARVLAKLNLQEIILHEQASGGKTIIEKFETYSDVGFAVVLLSPDDLGCSKLAPKDLRSRARQNVIFELGFFIGKLGRKHVFSLYKAGLGNDIELPSDFAGVVYTPFDNGGGWQLKLVQEMQEAGYDVDPRDLLPKK